MGAGLILALGCFGFMALGFAGIVLLAALGGDGGNASAGSIEEKSVLRMKRGARSQGVNPGALAGPHAPLGVGGQRLRFGHLAAGELLRLRRLQADGRRAQPLRQLRSQTLELLPRERSI